MNWRNFLLVSIFSFSAFTFAQSNLLNAKTPADIGKKTEAELNADNDNPLPYGYVGDRDILMGKTIWEFIDINQRVNFPLYFPVDDGKDLGPDRRPLYQVLMDGIRDKKITEVYDSGYFTVKKTYEEILKNLTFIDTTDQGIEELNAGSKTVSPEFIVKYEIKPYNVSGYKVKGFWYFDKRQGELKYRLLGICPRVVDVYDLQKPVEEQTDVDLFWIYFPDARATLHEAKAFNEKNSAMPFTFDHLMNSRRFSGSVYLEENVYGDREIAEYMKDNSQMQLLESDRVKEKIRNFELDMWNY
jgi:gliding motility associated protien GldN